MLRMTLDVDRHEPALGVDLQLFLAGVTQACLGKQVRETLVLHIRWYTGVIKDHHVAVHAVSQLRLTAFACQHEPAAARLMFYVRRHALHLNHRIEKQPTQGCMQSGAAPGTLSNDSEMLSGASHKEALFFARNVRHFSHRLAGRATVYLALPRRKATSTPSQSHAVMVAMPYRAAAASA